MENINRILADLLTEFTTLEKGRKEYRTVLDDVLRMTTGEYVEKSAIGYFPDATQPAFKCVRACVFLAKAATCEDPKEMKTNLESALQDLEAALWGGVDANSKKFKSNFLQLRKDVDSLGEDAYNHKLGELYNASGDMYEMAKGKGIPHVENCFTAIAQLVICASVPTIPPFGLKEEEQSQAIVQAEKMIRFALNYVKRQI